MYIYWQIWPRFTYKNYMINFTSLNYNWNWIFTLDPTSLLFMRGIDQKLHVLYIDLERWNDPSTVTCRYNINFIELSLFGFFREINSDTNSNTWIFAYKFHKNVRENVKTGIFFFKFSSLYLVCGTCIDHALIQKIYLDLKV